MADIHMDSGAGAGAGSGSGSGAGAGAGSGVDTDVDMTSSEYHLATCMHGSAGAYTALCVTTSGLVVVGTSGPFVEGWMFNPAANSFTSAFMTQVPGMPTKVWSLLAGPDGTFVAGCSSGIVAVFDGAGSVVKQLKGHTHNVTSLAWMADPNLLASGAWGGEARVWNMTSGEAVKVMGEHENSVCVCPLPNGDLVTGSTGRQKEAGGLPTEFRLRLWRAGEEVSMVEDHTGAVRDVCALPAVGFASVSNDGTLRIRNKDMTTLRQFETTMRASGFRNGIFRVRCLPGNLLATCDEDYHVRLYNPLTALVQAIMLPGDASDVAMLPNGDIITCGTAVGDGSVMAVWTQDAGRVPSAAVAAEWSGYMSKLLDWVAALERRECGGDDKPAGEIELPPGFQLKGLYSQRASLPGRVDNEKGFFQSDDGRVIFSVWNAAAGEWQGAYIYDGYRGQGSGGQKGSTVSLGGVESKYREEYDYVEKIELDMSGDAGGPSQSKMTYLCFNATEEPTDILQRYMKTYDIPAVPAYVQQLQNKILQEWKRVNELHKAQNARPTYKFFPSVGFVLFHSGDLDKAMGKLRDVAGDLSPATLDKLQAVVDILKKTSFYHSTTVSRTQHIPALLKAVTTLPPAAVFPAFDVLRALFLHPDGAMAACEKPNGLAKQALERVLALVTAGDTPVATVVLGWRCVANMFNGPGKALLIDHMDELIAAATPLLASPKKTLRLTGVTVLRNFATLLHVLAEDTKAATPHVATALKLVELVLGVVAAEADAKVLLFALIALGQLAWLSDSTLAAAAARSDVLTTTTVMGIASSNSDVAQCVTDLSSLLASRSSFK